MNCRVFQLTLVTCLQLPAEAKLTRPGSQLWRQNTPTRRTLATTGPLDGSAPAGCLAAALNWLSDSAWGICVAVPRAGKSGRRASPSMRCEEDAARGGDGSQGSGGVPTCCAQDRKRFAASLTLGVGSRAMGPSNSSRCGADQDVWLTMMRRLRSHPRDSTSALTTT